MPAPKKSRAGSATSAPDHQATFPFKETSVTARENERPRSKGIVMVPRNIGAFKAAGIEAMGIILLNEGSEEIPDEMLEKLQEYFEGELEIFRGIKNPRTKTTSGLRITFPLTIAVNKLREMLAFMGWPTEKVAATPQLLETTVQTEFNHSLREPSKK
jgi:hypothetical protein